MVVVRVSRKAAFSSSGFCLHVSPCADIQLSWVVLADQQTLVDLLRPSCNSQQACDENPASESKGVSLGYVGRIKT